LNLIIFSIFYDVCLFKPCFEIEAATEFAHNVQGLAKCDNSIPSVRTVVDFYFKVQDKNFLMSKVPSP